MFSFIVCQYYFGPVISTDYKILRVYIAFSILSNYVIQQYFYLQSVSTVNSSLSWLLLPENHYKLGSFRCAYHHVFMIYILNCL